MKRIFYFFLSLAMAVTAGVVSSSCTKLDNPVDPGNTPTQVSELKAQLQGSYLYYPIIVNDVMCGAMSFNLAPAGKPSRMGLFSTPDWEKIDMDLKLHVDSIDIDWDVVPKYEGFKDQGIVSDALRITMKLGDNQSNDIYYPIGSMNNDSVVFLLPSEMGPQDIMMTRFDNKENISVTDLTSSIGLLTGAVLNSMVKFVSENKDELTSMTDEMRMEFLAENGYDDLTDWVYDFDSYNASARTRQVSGAAALAADSKGIDYANWMKSIRDDVKVRDMVIPGSHDAGTYGIIGVLRAFGQTLKEQAQGHYLPGKNAEISNPDSLANFIKWAAKACPAKKYVLVLNDHGGGYSPDAEIYPAKAVATRGVIFDDAYRGNHFSAPSLNHAIKASGIRPDVVYFDACLMNTMEYAFELKDVADYLVASTYVTLAGAPYATLIDVLSAAHDDMRYALEKYTEYYVKSFEPEDENEVNYYDMTVTETARLDQLGKSMREFTDRLCNTYKNGTAEQKQKINNVTRDAVRVTDSGALYDAGRYMEAMRKALPEVFDDAFWAELKESFNNCIAAQYTSKYLLNHDYQVDYSVLLATRGTYLQSAWRDVESDPDSKILTSLGFFAPDGKFTIYVVKDGLFKKGVTPAYTLELADQGQWGGTLEAVYGALAFDKATGWSRWLLLNEQQPSLWCNNDFNTPLPKISD